MSIATDIFIGPQVLTVAIPLGTLFLVMLWGFFQRRTDAVTGGAEADRSRTRNHSNHAYGARPFLAVAGILLVVWLVPPLAPWSRRYEFVEALQFSFFAIVIPALVVIGSPWALLGLASPRPQRLDDDGRPLPPTAAPGPVDRLAQGRRRHPEALRAAAFACLYLAGVRSSGGPRWPSTD